MAELLSFCESRILKCWWQELPQNEGGLYSAAKKVVEFNGFIFTVKKDLPVILGVASRVVSELFLFLSEIYAVFFFQLQ